MVERSSGSIDVIKKNNFVLKIFFVPVQQRKRLRRQQSLLPLFLGLFFSGMLVFQELHVADPCLLQHFLALAEAPFLVTGDCDRQREEQGFRMRSLESTQIVREGGGKAVIALEFIALQPVLHDARIGIASMMRDRQLRIALAPPSAVFAPLSGCLWPHASRAAGLAGYARQLFLAGSADRSAILFPETEKLLEGQNFADLILAKQTLAHSAAPFFPPPGSSSGSAGPPLGWLWFHHNGQNRLYLSESLCACLPCRLSAQAKLP